MLRRTATRLIILIVVFIQSAGELITAPRSTESKVGDTTYFNCSTDLESVEIFWHHGLSYIYTGEKILNLYRGRFDIDRNASNGSHNLVIHSVEPGDAGEYICIDDDGHGIARSAELVVLDNELNCQSNIQPDGVIGQNIFNIPPDEIQLTCIATYHGNIPPQMEWKKVGDNSSIKDRVAFNISSDRVIYTLNLKGDISLNNSSYVCQTTRSTQNRYKCTSETINVLHFVGGNMIEQKVFRGDKITCTTSSNTFVCISQWHIGNYTFDETITTQLDGEYLCRVKCSVRGRDYYFEAMKARVAEAPTFPYPSKSGTIAAAVVVPIVIVLVALIAVYIVRLRERRHATLIYGHSSMLASLLSKKALTHISESERTNDNITEEEIELLYKINKVVIEGMEEMEEVITGIAILKEKLFIVRETGLYLEVYDCTNFNRSSRLIKMRGFGGAGNMCSCEKNCCLYIMNNKATRLEIVKLNSEGNLQMHWPTKDKAERLSATPDGNIITMVQDEHMLLEYLPDGKLIREIRLPDYIHPWHAIKRDDRYIVCYGKFTDTMHGVCLVDEEGKVEQSFGREIGSAEDQLNMPYYLAVGSNGCVIVSDLFNNRMMMLDSNLKFMKKIVPRFKQRFLFPADVVLDEKRLVVIVVKGDPIAVEGEETEENSIAMENCRLRRVPEEQKIEEDCRILVFDIQPLLL